MNPTAEPPPDPSPLRPLLLGIGVGALTLAAIGALLHWCGWGFWGAER